MVQFHVGFSHEIGLIIVKLSILLLCDLRDLFSVPFLVRRSFSVGVCKVVSYVAPPINEL